MPEGGAQRKQLVWLAPIILILIVMGINIYLDNKRPYKEVSLGENNLNIPKNLLPRSEPDLVNMIRDHLSTAITNRVQLVQYADELLPQAGQYGDAIASSSIIWTIETASTPAPPNQQVFEADPETGLFKALDSTNTGTVYYRDSPTEPNWTTQCIEFKTIRVGSGWGRCSLEFQEKNILVRLHYDGRLVGHTGDIKEKVQKLLLSWLQN